MRKAGFRVVVACESPDSAHDRLKDYQGVKLEYFPVKNSLRPLSEIVFDVRSLIEIGSKVDTIYMLGYGAGLFFWIARLLRKTLVVNSDGMEWMRPKFGRTARFLLRTSERFGLSAANVIVADSRSVAKYVQRTYGKTPVFLAYGTPTQASVPRWDPDTIEKWHRGLSSTIRPDNYYLVLARMEPDNNIDKIIQGFTLSHTSRRLVVVGPCMSANYLSRLQNLANEDPRILLLGPVYEPAIKNMLRWHCAAYVHGHMVGGTNPSLLEALGAGCVVIGTDVEFNREVIGNEGKLPAIYFRPDPTSIAQAIDSADPDIIGLREKARVFGPERIKEAYNWPDIIREYGALFEKL